MGADDILEVQDLEVCYTTRFGTPARHPRPEPHACIAARPTAWSGESGCGKSTLAFAIMGYLERNALDHPGEDPVQRRGPAEEVAARRCGRSGGKRSP